MQVGAPEHVAVPSPDGSRRIETGAPTDVEPSMLLKTAAVTPKMTPGMSVGGVWVRVTPMEEENSLREG